MRLIKIRIVLLMISLVSLILNAQQVNTLYFMENIPERHFLNPSFQPTNDFYLSLPVVGFTQLDISNNSLAFKDIIFNVNGKTTTFLNSNADMLRFYNTIKSNTVVRADFQTNFLSVGFRHEFDYWTFSLTEKIDGTINIPKDVFNLSLFGSSDLTKNSYNLNSMQTDISIYTELALGYSKNLDDTWIIGGKLKLLAGQANVSNNNDQVLFQGNVEKIIGTLNYSIPGKLNIDSDFHNLSYIKPSGIFGWLSPTGVGAGMDIGFEYRLNDHLRLSGAINDLGFIHWLGKSQNIHYKVNYPFNGIKSFNSSSTINNVQEIYNQFLSNNGLIDSISNAFDASPKSKITYNSYTTVTTAKLNFGVEYAILNDKLSFGLLSYTRLFRNIATEELTGSLNARPKEWLNASLSYSVIQGRMNTIGVGLGLKTGPFQWFVAADYIPFAVSNLILSNSGSFYPGINSPIPYNSTSFNVSAGLNLVFNKKKNKSEKITRGRSLNILNGLYRSTKKQDCNCDWN